MVDKNKYIVFFVISIIFIIILVFLYVFFKYKKESLPYNDNSNTISNTTKNTNTLKTKRDKVLFYDKIVKKFGVLSKNTGGGGGGDKNYQGIYFMDTGEKIEGQRDPDKRLDLIRKIISFKNKSILDVGCNSGEMLFNLLKYNIKYGVGLDYDPYKINMCNLMKRYNKINNLDFFVYDVKKDNANSIISLLPENDNKVDIAFLFSVCQAWIYPCNNLINILFILSETLVIEINGNENQKTELIKYLKNLYTNVKEITDSKYCTDCDKRLLFIANNKKNITFGSSGASAIEINDEKIKKIFYNKNKFQKEKYWLKFLQKFKFIPRIINIDDDNLIIEMENCGNPLDIKDKSINFEKKIRNIQKILNKNSIYHNDLHNKNILVKNNDIYIIDYEWISKIKDDPKIKKYGKITTNNDFFYNNMNILDNI